MTHTTHQALRELDRIVRDLFEVLREGRRAIGDHNAPDDCYATGPMTGDSYRDLIECPACSFIAMYDRVVARTDQRAVIASLLATVPDRVVEGGL